MPDFDKFKGPLTDGAGDQTSKRGKHYDRANQPDLEIKSVVAQFDESAKKVRTFSERLHTVRSGAIKFIDRKRSAANDVDTYVLLLKQIADDYNTHLAQLRNVEQILSKTTRTSFPSSGGPDREVSVLLQSTKKLIAFTESTRQVQLDLAEALKLIKTNDGTRETQLAKLNAINVPKSP